VTVALRAVTPLRIGTPLGIRIFNPGESFTPKSLKPLIKLIEEKRAEPAEPCPACHKYAWWLSTHNALLCGVCHPPASPYLVKRWIGHPGEAPEPVDLIGSVIKEIEKTYASSAVRWCRQERPGWWKRVIELEEGINKTAKNGDIPHLESLLEKWKVEITSMVKAFIEANIKSKRASTIKFQ
jgi:hypothetical protein